MEFKIKTSEFIKSAVDSSSFIHDEKIQILFAGKSNVGKSSFINSVLSRKKLAKTSQTPGKTRTINYFLINKDFYFVDLPGFGYAKVPLYEKRSWEKMINKYLNQTEEIKLAFSLIDIRHDPSQNDISMVNMFTQFGIDQIIILSKCDKISKNEINKRLMKTRKLFEDQSVIEILPYSSLKNTNRERVLEIISVLTEDSL
ncbi:MAG: YihA family ribosome biogenesis GTP-binding protein [Candidatus Cloacimonadota bacterium]|nr:MAG: YihA family ribosome biogenesis GTP-binding protein [Candidatus Cloacimonadota bacterium]PIE77540.1 MAG: YihA family ribosome biogenesis GTP-binding protein [Candidatus Delongbacteria bacterium]